MTDKELERLHQKGVVVKTIFSPKRYYKATLKAFAMGNILTGVLYSMFDDGYHLIASNQRSYNDLDSLVKGFDFNVSDNKRAWKDAKC